MSTFLIVLAAIVCSPVVFTLVVAITSLLLIVCEGWAYIFTPYFWRDS